MFIIDKNEQLSYSFNAALEITATLEKLEIVAKALNLEIDYQKLCDQNNIKNNIYDSQSMGPIEVTDMATEHLQNAILKELRLFFVKSNFAGLEPKDFLKKIDGCTEDVMDLKMLWDELLTRI